MATGAAVGYQQRDAFPIVAAGMISAIFIAGYEYQIRNPSTDDAGGPRATSLAPQSEPSPGLVPGAADFNRVYRAY
jgi:hypothetical protein